MKNHLKVDQSNLRKYHNLKQSFYDDAIKIEKASQLLNTRKNEIENLLNETNHNNKKLSEENNNFKNQLFDLLNEKNLLTNDMHENYVPISLYNECMNKLNHFENKA